MTFFSTTCQSSSTTPGLVNEVLSEADRRGMCHSSNRPCCVSICHRGDRGRVGLAWGTFPVVAKRPSYIQVAELELLITQILKVQEPKPETVTTALCEMVATQHNHCTITLAARWLTHCMYQVVVVSQTYPIVVILFKLWFSFNFTFPSQWKYDFSFTKISRGSILIATHYIKQ